MSYYKAVVYLMILVFFFAASSGKAQTSGQYAIAQSFVLHHEENGIVGTLQLSVDKRLSESVQEKLWGNGDWSFVFPPDSSVYKDFSTHPPVKAKLCIRDSAGKIVAERNLETPLAKLEVWNPTTEANQLFLLTQDYSTGEGSYNGLVTTLLKVSDAASHEAKALDTESHQEGPIRLLKSLKSDWRIAQRESKPEILSVSCHPRNDGKFVTDYARYSFDGSRWFEYKREQQGLWESDQPFPERSLFR